MTHAAPLEFDSPAHCLSDLQRKIWSVPYGSGERKGERQHLCERCRRWKYSDERCNLFVLGSDRPGSAI